MADSNIIRIDPAPPTDNLRQTLLKRNAKERKRRFIVPISSWGGKERVLYWLNVSEGLLHLASAIAALVVAIVYAPQSYLSELRTDFIAYDANSTAFGVDSRSLGYYALIWVDIPAFPLITAAFHLSIAFWPAVWEYYIDQVKNKGSNPLRWIEYSITASLMTWVILQLSGVTNIFILVVVGVLMNIALQAMGYIQEKVKQLTYMPTVIGWLLFVGQWTIIMGYFFAAVTSERPPGAATVPWFVYVIIIGLFFMFSAFGFVQLAGVAEYLSPYQQEIALSILSLTAKLFLTWNLLIGIALNPIK
jgi:hypothetical protein